MSDFADDATVGVRFKDPIPGPGHRFPSVGVTLTHDWKDLDGETAQAIKDALPHTLATEETVEFEVRDEGSTPNPSDELVEIVGEKKAQRLVDEYGTTTVEEANDLSDEQLDAVKGFGEKSIESFRAAANDLLG